MTDKMTLPPTEKSCGENMPRTRTGQILLPMALLLVLLGGCGFPTMASLVEGLNQQTDLELVCDGSSSYLLLLDSLLVEDPDDKALLVNTTKAYSAYVVVMPECGRPER
ncbi:MAG: hypothetical protein KAS94_02770, partial [Desulfobulbaceae bacterium]|nr:hypothetical protein [Desulfobulbaceae bacterium]